MRTLVVDIDDTLLIGNRMSRFFWWVSLQTQRIGRRLQKVNPRVASRLSAYDVVIVLTGRDVKESPFTENQLRNARIGFDKLICCPRKKLISDWKWSEIAELGKDTPLEWIDDLLDDSSVEDHKSRAGINLTPLPPGRILEGNNLSSELEWL